eukprot:7255531-Lingulodinium_polyedra.AAC.1
MCIRDSPCAVWTLCSQSACNTCSTLGACHIRRAAADAPTPHAGGHGQWRPHTARDIPSSQAVLAQTSEDRQALWPAEVGRAGWCPPPRAVDAEEASC